MSKFLHADFKDVSGKVYFVKLICIIHGRKMRFTASTQSSLSEKLIFGQFEVIFLNV